MQLTPAHWRFEHRLFIFGSLWLLAAGAGYFLGHRPDLLWQLPAPIQNRLAPMPLRQFSDPFPTFAVTIALSLLSVSALECGKWKAAMVCCLWTVLAIMFQFAQRPDVSSWIVPRLPVFFHSTWPLSELERMLGSGLFSVSNVWSAVLGGVIAYSLVLSSIPASRRG